MAKTKEPPAATGAAEDARALAPRNWWARLGPHGVLLGFSETPIEGAPEVPVDCDLAPMKYRWDGERFMPLHDKARADASTVALEALQGKVFAVALWAALDGRPIPQYCRDWLEAWRKTVDGAGVPPEPDFSQER